MRFLFRPPAAEAAGLLACRGTSRWRSGTPSLLLEVPQRGISRHVVRFVAGEGRVYALKEIAEPLARQGVRAARRVRGGGAADRLGAGHLRGPARRPGRDPGHPLPRVLDVLPVPVLRPARRRTPPSSCSTPWSSCWSGCTWPASSGATARCPTRCSGPTPARWPPTWSTPRPSSGTRRCRRGSAPTTSTWPASGSGAELMDLGFGGLLPDGHRPDRDGRRACPPRYEALWEEVTHEEVFGSRSSVPGGRAAAAAQRPRLRRRRGGAGHRRRRAPGCGCRPGSPSRASTAGSCSG